MVVCSICQYPVVGEAVSPFGCDHLYHSVCINDWIRTDQEVNRSGPDDPHFLNHYRIRTTNQCPLCRSDIGQEEVWLDVEPDSEPSSAAAAPPPLPPQPEPEIEEENRHRSRPPPPPELEESARHRRRPPPPPELEESARHRRRPPPPPELEESARHRRRPPPPPELEESARHRSRPPPPPEVEESGRDRRRPPPPPELEESARHRRRPEVEEENHGRRRRALEFEEGAHARRRPAHEFEVEARHRRRRRRRREFEEGAHARRRPAHEFEVEARHRRRRRRRREIEEEAHHRGRPAPEIEVEARHRRREPTPEWENLGDFAQVEERMEHDDAVVVVEEVHNLAQQGPPMQAAALPEALVDHVQEIAGNDNEQVRDEVMPEEEAHDRRREPTPDSEWEDLADFVQVEERMEHDGAVPVPDVEEEEAQQGPPMQAAALQEPVVDDVQEIAGNNNEQVPVATGPWMPPESAYICHFCGKKFNTTSAKSQHLFIHKPEKLSCPTCGTLFTYPGNLRAHRKKFGH